MPIESLCCFTFYRVVLFATTVKYNNNTVQPQWLGLPLGTCILMDTYYSWVKRVGRGVTTSIAKVKERVELYIHSPPPPQNLHGLFQGKHYLLYFHTTDSYVLDLFRTSVSSAAWMDMVKKLIIRKIMVCPLTWSVNILLINNFKDRGPAWKTKYSLASQEILAFNVNRNSTDAFTKACHLSLSSAR